MALSSLLMHLMRLCRLVRPAPAGRVDRYTARDVRHLLDPGSPAGPDRRRAALEVAAVPSAWTGYLSPRRASELGRLAERLPTVVYLYASGTPFDEISRRVGCWTAWGAERALDAACACIAAHLNRRRAPGPS